MLVEEVKLYLKFIYFTTWSVVYLTSTFKHNLQKTLNLYQYNHISSSSIPLFWWKFETSQILDLEVQRVSYNSYLYLSNISIYTRIYESRQDRYAFLSVAPLNICTCWGLDHLSRCRDTFEK